MTEQVQETEPLQPKPWWESRAQVGTLVTMLASALGLIGYAVDIEQITEVAWLGITLISSFVAFWGNVKRLRPLDTKQVLPGLRLRG